MISEISTTLEAQLIEKHTLETSQRIITGIQQVQSLWVEKDGAKEELISFCMDHFYSGSELDALFYRLQEKLGNIFGYTMELERRLKTETEESAGKLVSFDEMFASYQPTNHILADLFENKIAFLALLNFKIESVSSMEAYGDSWSRRKWAETNLVSQFSSRVPFENQRSIDIEQVKSSKYISEYNINMNHIVSDDGARLFEGEKKLISHWGLRDEIRSCYRTSFQETERQETIQVIMERVVSQEIPQIVINNDVDWDPFRNTVNGKASSFAPDIRYGYLHRMYKLQKLIDEFHPANPTHLMRRFNLEAKISEKKVENLLVSILQDETGPLVGSFLKRHLGRDLKPFDIWFNKFENASKMGNRELDELTRKRYPSAQAFEKDIPFILEKLGFDPAISSFLGNHIKVTSSRGAGHAIPAPLKSEKCYLRTRVESDGMTYHGFNIAMHELGHSVEQVFSLHKMDYPQLRGVPNNAFTECFAFIFQSRDLEILGVSSAESKQTPYRTVEQFWNLREMCAVSLVDIYVWRWMYQKSHFSETELKNAVIGICNNIWNEHFSSIFQCREVNLLGIYSHMISHGLYLMDYPLGRIISYQLERYFKSHSLPSEMERMCSIGNISPSRWMKEAIGEDISPTALLKDAREAVQYLDLNRIRR